MSPTSSPNGHCWVHIGYVKTSKANWFVALTRLASDKGLVQIIENLCKCVFAATVSANFLVFHLGLSQAQELVLRLSLKFLDQSGLVQFEVCCMFNLLALSDIDNSALIWITLLSHILQVSTHLHTHWLSQDISLFLHEISMSFYVS